MRTEIFDTPALMAEAAARKMLEVVRNKPDALLVLAAGFTQNETYARFAELLREENIDTRRLKLLGLDEWGGLNGGDEGSCRAYINERVIAPLKLGREQIVHFLDGKKDPREEVRLANAALDAHGPIDLLVLGIGMNGHVGFNEPGADPGERAHFLTLSTTSSSVGQKYFKDNKTLKTGLTLGLLDLLKAETILVQVTGGHKAEVARRLLNKEDGATLPASYLWRTEATLMMDQGVFKGTLAE